MRVLTARKALPLRSRAAFFLAIVPLLLALACGGSDEEPARTDGTSVGDRYLRLFEARELGASLFVHDGALPPSLARLVNPGLNEDTPEDDIVSIPVPADGELLGSYLIRRRDGTIEVWLSYDVPGADVDVETTMRELLDETPWQVTGGQSNELFGVVSFQSTVSGDIEGFATIQPLPSSATYLVQVDRDGQVLDLELPRGSFMPEIDARFRELSSGLEVTQVLSDDQLQAGDVILAVGETAVEDERDLYEALRALASTGEPRAAVLYRLQFVSPAPADDPIFVTPPTRPLPDGFPADFLVSSDLSVLDVSWSSEAAGDLYQLTMVTPRSAFEIADDYRSALETAGWELTGDEAQGFGTTLSFEDEPNGLSGIATIDEFDADDDLVAVILQVQAVRGN